MRWQVSARANADARRDLGERPSDDERSGQHDDDASERPSKEQEGCGNRTGIHGSHAISASHSGAVSSRLSRSDATTTAAPIASAASTHAGGSTRPRRGRLARDRDDAKQRPGAGSPRERRRDRCWLHAFLRISFAILASVGQGFSPA